MCFSFSVWFDHRGRNVFKSVSHSPQFDYLSGQCSNVFDVNVKKLLVQAGRRPFLLFGD